MLAKPESCRTCSLWRVTHSQKQKPFYHTIEGLGFCEPEGFPHLGVAFVGEASGEKEEQDGKPLRPYAASGSIHKRTLRAVGVNPPQVYALNVVSCRPPNNKLDGMPYEPDAIGNCAPILNTRLNFFRNAVRCNSGIVEPVTVALGDVAWRTLTGLTGDKLSISYARGYPQRTHAHGLVIGTWHPAFVRRHTKLLGVLTKDYAKAFKLAREGFKPFPTNYKTQPSPEEIIEFRDRVLAAGPHDVLIFDFETVDIDKSAPSGTWPALISVQFSLEVGTGIHMYITRDTLPIVKQIMAAPITKAGHNIWDFDIPLAIYHGITVGGLAHDTMWMYHHKEPDLTLDEAGKEADTDLRFSTSAGLQSVASFYGADTLWKHERMIQNEETQRHYAVADVDNNGRIMWGLPGIPSLPDDLRQYGLWNGYERYVYQFFPVLKKMAERGLPINRVRQRGLDSDLAAIEIEIDDKIQRIHPDELKRLSPANGFVNGPKVGPKIRWVVSDPCGAYIMSGLPKPGCGFGHWEWFDEADDVTVDDAKEMAEEAEGDVAVAGVWRPMVERTFYEDKIKQTSTCACVHDPVGKEKGLKAFDGRRPDKSCSTCAGKGVIRSEVSGDVVRWARLLPFRPSNKQLVAYITHRKHKVPYDRKTKKNTTAAKGINELAKKTKDPLYQSILDIRTINKLRSTYVTGKGWVMYGANGQLDWATQPPRIHTTPTLGPATGQTSTRRPNIQNQPKHVRNENLRHLDLPKKLRSLIEARPGHKIVEFDLKSAHALTLGLEARDASYMRLARIDVHSYMTSIMAAKRGLWPAAIDLNVSDVDLKKALKEVRNHRVDCTCSDTARVKGKVESHCKGVHFEADIRDTQAKPAILGYGFGLQGMRLYETNKESFRDEYEAQETLELINEIFHLLKTYRDDVLQEAHIKRYLTSRGGFIRWFWHVYDFKYDPTVEGKFVQSHGEDAEDAMAFRPANTAFVYIRNVMLRLEELGVNDEANFINTVHDSLVFEIPDEKMDTCCPVIKAELERPQLELGDPIVAPEGLWIECEAKVGSTWGVMTDLKI